MTTKAIMFSSKSGSGAQLPRYQKFKSTILFHYSSSKEFEKAPTSIGKVDYLLVTGGHGDFQTGKPTTFNDVDMAIADHWIGKVVGEAKAIILDFCFSTAVAPSLLKLVPEGGCVICAHGEAEGWFASVDPSSEPTRTIGDVVSTASRAITDMTGVFSSASMLVKTKAEPVLYTAVGGKDRTAGLKRRAVIGLKETAAELEQLDRYVEGKGVKIEVKKPEEIAALIAHALPTALV